MCKHYHILGVTKADSLRNKRFYLEIAYKRSDMMLSPNGTKYCLCLKQPRFPDAQANMMPTSLYTMNILDYYVKSKCA